MFTGLVEGLGKVLDVELDEGGARIEVSTGLAEELRPGDSVAVSGVCLTAIHAEDDTFLVDAIPETLRRSSLGSLAAGDAVNLELPVRAGGRLGGHIVQGHVDGMGTIDRVEDAGVSRVVRIACDPSLLRYIVEKGSIAVEGVSLTVASVDDDGFEVSLIPETLDRTNLAAASPGRVVNLEVDVLAKYVEKLVARA